MVDDLYESLKDINNRMSSLVEYYNSEFNSKMVNGKLILKLTRCGNRGCKFCPHGPYWYRAVFNKKTKKFMFQYLSSNIKQNKLEWYEKKFWDRIKFYNEEARRLREQKRQISRAIKVNKKILKG